MDRLRFGTAGLPETVKGKSTGDGINEIVRLKLDCMEMEFVHGINMKEVSASSIGTLSKKNDVVMTVHGPYHINLNAIEKEKRAASRERILNTARIGALANGWSVTFHAAFLLKIPPDKVTRTVQRQLSSIVKVLDEERNKIWLRPETSGKVAQWGTLDQILEVSRMWPQVMPCVDFAHLHAYDGGRTNGYDDFCRILDKVEDRLGPKALKDMHMHVSGIEYGPRGERRHLPLKMSKFGFHQLLQALKDREVAGCLICESPIMGKDAQLLKREYNRL